jgi:VanZ family protein
MLNDPKVRAPSPPSQRFLFLAVRLSYIYAEEKVFPFSLCVIAPFSVRIFLSSVLIHCYEHPDPFILVFSRSRVSSLFKSLFSLQPLFFLQASPSTSLLSFVFARSARVILYRLPQSIESRNSMLSYTSSIYTQLHTQKHFLFYLGKANLSLTSYIDIRDTANFIILSLLLSFVFGCS